MHGLPKRNNSKNNITVYSKLTNLCITDQLKIAKGKYFIDHIENKNIIKLSNIYHSLIKKLYNSITLIHGLEIKL